MSRLVFLIIGLFLSLQVIAQTGIGTTVPNVSAKLDVYADNKGFLPPRVTLTSATDIITVPNAAEGLLVYNKGSVGLQAGYYYWNGANWATIATANSAGNGVSASDLFKLYHEGYSTTSGKAPSADGYSFTVPVSGRYEFNFNSTGWNTNGSNIKLTFNIRQGTSVIGTDYHQSNSSNVWAEYEGRVEVNLIAGVTYNAQVVTSIGNRDYRDWDKIMYKMVAGNLPVTGQTVEYGIARYTGADGASLSANAIVAFDATAAGNLAWSGNKFTLKANKTYEIESYLSVYHTSAGVAAIFQIYNYTNSSVLASGFYISINGSGGYNVNGNGPMRCIITPTTDIEVGVRISSAYGGWPSIVGSTNTIGANSAPNQSYLLVKQIGSSAIVNPWILSGNNSYNTTGNVGIGTISPTEKLEVSGNVKANNFMGTASSSKLFLLEAYANVSYTLPGSYTYDLCRYSVVNNTVNVPSSWFNTSTYTFTPQKAGYWEISASYDVYRNGEASMVIYKNGANVGVVGSISAVTLIVNRVIYLNGSTDYINIYNVGFNSNARGQGAATSWFQARWVGE